MAEQIGLTPEQVWQVVATIVLSLLIGWEREENRHTDRVYIIGGVRTFPIIGLIGYGASIISPDSPIGPAIGFTAIGAFLLVSYLHKLKTGDHGGTSELAGMLVFIVGAVVGRGLIWVGASMTVATVLLLHAKAPLERFATKLPRHEIATLVQFLLLAVVILPVLPNEEYSQFRLNPFKIWLIVVAVSGISYASYIAQQVLKGRQTELLTAILGGTYSSTATTVVLAKRSVGKTDRRLYVGAMTLTSSVMYLRIAILLAIFNPGLGWSLSLRLVALALVGCATAYFIAAPRRPRETEAEGPVEPARNPLEIWSALVLAGLFVAVTVASRYATANLGSAGLYVLGAVLGISDVDPFILSLTQTAGAVGGPTIHAASVAILIATASNNALKGAYAMIFGDRRTGLLTFMCIGALGALSFLSLIGMQ